MHNNLQPSEFAEEFSVSYNVADESIKHLSTSAPGTSTIGRSSSPHPTKSSKNDMPEKEKKRKELSSGRQKKFHRHFQQVAVDERVINYFSCALVSDILLQGHLYITDNYFAFYSNVFGFVTKLLIPIVSVVKISKEKTAKIIPNAVGVATVDERHVFGSFMSREAAYRLMLSVWRPIMIPTIEPITEIENIAVKIPDVEISECSVEDDSSSAISGNESPPLLQESTTSDASHTLRHRNNAATNSIVDGIVSGGITATGIIGVGGLMMKSIPNNTTSRNPLKNNSDNKNINNSNNNNNNTNNNNSNNNNNINNNYLQQSYKSSPQKIMDIKTMEAAATLSSAPSSRFNFIQLRFPTNFHVVYLGVFLVIILSILSGYLLYKILDIQAKVTNSSPIDFKMNGKNNIDVYAEVLKWQKELQSKSVDEAQIILNSNLEQIARVRKSLETLSILINDKRAANLHDVSDNYVTDEGSSMDLIKEL